MTRKGKSRQTLIPAITATRLRELLSYDEETGEFRWIAKSSVKSQARVGGKAGSVYNSRGSKCITVDGRTYRAHRLAWLHFYGEWPRWVIDHIDGNPGDNRITNLRDASPSINSQNKRRPNGATASGLIGAHWARDRWQSSIKAGGTNFYLGKFQTAEEAHAAYVSAKRRLHEGCTL